MPLRDDPNLRKLQSSPLIVEPGNEQGVVALFAGICEEEFGMRIQDIRAGYPDCTAIGKSGRRIEIEFEYESSRFNHPDDAAGKLCDWVVCWIDNAKKGEKRRKNIKVKELSSLSRFSELGPKVWIQPYQPANVERLTGYRRHTAWTVPSEARKGDLLLVYRSGQTGGDHTHHGALNDCGIRQET